MTDDGVIIKPQATPPTTSYNPLLAAAFSFFLPGAGQALNGSFWKGVFFLVLSFIVLPAESLSLVYLSGTASVALLLPLLSPWVYSMVSAAREATRLNHTAAVFNPSKGAIYVTVLLVVVFPVVALVFSIITLLLLPLEVLTGINDWTAGFRRAVGVGG